MVFCRKLCEKDISNLPELLAELGYKVTKAEIQEYYLNLAGNKSHKLCIAETGNGELVGLVHVTVYATLIMKKMAIVLSLIVRNDYRGMGVGKLLMNEAELWATAQGCSGIRLYSNAKRTDAHQFYNCLGYETKANSLLFQKFF